MRHCRVLLLALVAGGLLGCTAPRPVGSASWLQRFRPQPGLSGPDVVQLDVALVEVPAGDRFINGDLWAFVDEQVIALDRKAVLEDNGFRVGQVSSTPPAGLLELLTEKRTSPAPRRIQLHADKASRPLELGPPKARCTFRLHQGDKPTAVELEQAQCSLLVTPTLTEDGRTRLVCVPQMEHAARGLIPWQPSPDRSGWSLQMKKPTEPYPALGWEVTLEPNEYVVVGARYDRPGTLGHEVLVRIDEPVPVQRLLVIRVTRDPVRANYPPVPLPGAEGTPSRPPPLALQASWSSARGVAP